MKATFTFDEMVYNTVCSGRIIYHDGDEKVIDYVKLDKNTRQIIIHCVDGDVFSAMQDDLHEFKVNNLKEWRKPNKKKLRGK